jgi:hypothetical protein
VALRANGLEGVLAQTARVKKYNAAKKGSSVVAGLGLTQVALRPASSFERHKPTGPAFGSPFILP